MSGKKTASLDFKLSLPEVVDARHFVPLQIALESLCKINAFYLRQSIAAGRPYPPLYASGLYYKTDAPGKEDWWDIPATLRRGHGDCKKLVAYRVAELRVAGIECEPVLTWQWIPRDVMIELGYPKKHLPKKGVWLVHCLVRYPDGTIEDPSKELGMKGAFTNAI